MATNDVEIRFGSEDNSAADFDALKTRLRELAGKVVTATADVDTKEGQREAELLVAKLQEISKKVYAARLDVAGGARAMANITALEDATERFNDKQATAKLGVDTADADAKIDHTDVKLDELGHKSVTPKVNVDTSGATSALSGLASSLTGLPAIIAGVVAVLPAIPGALAGIGSAAGVTALAFAPVIKVLQDSAAVAASSSKSMKESSAQVAQTELANSTAIVNAQRAISDAKTQAAHDAITSDQAISQAEQAVASAQTQAAHDAITSAESVAQAEQSLKNAEATEQQAQESLTQARQQAVLTLQSLNDAQKDSALSAQQAKLNLQQAELNQQQVDKSSTSTALQKAQAALSVKEAQQALIEANQQATNSTKAANQANKEGINGMPGVLQAKRAQQQAIQQVAAAERALADTQRQARWTQQQDAQAIKNAQQGVAKAEQQAAWTQQKDAEAIKTAIQNLSNTYKQQGLAAQAASSISGGATAKLAQDMTRLTGAGREVVRQILALKQNMSGLSSTAQRAVLPGFSVFLNGVNALLPTINKEVGDMGRILGSAFAGAGHALESSGIQRELKAVLDEGNQFMQILIPAVGSFAGAILKMGAQSGPAVAGVAKAMAGILKVVGDLLVLASPGLSALVGDVGKGIGKWADSFDKWSKSKQARTDVNKFFTYLHDNGSTIMSIIKDLVKYIPDLFAGASAAASTELSVLNSFLGLVAKLPPSFAKPIVTLAGAMLVLSKTGVLKVGIQLVGAAKKLLGDSSVVVAGDAAAEAMGGAIRAAGVTVAGEFRAAISGGGAAGGAAAGAEAEVETAVSGGMLSAFASTAIRAALGGVFVAAIAYAVGSLVPKDKNKQVQKDQANTPSFVVKADNLFHLSNMAGWIDQYFSHPIRAWVENTLPSILKDAPKQFSNAMSKIEGVIAHSAAHWFDDARHGIASFGHDVASGFDKIRHDVASKWDNMLSDVKKFWTQTFPNAVHGGINDVISWIQQHLDKWRHDIASRWDDMLSDVKKFWTQQLPNAIKGALNDAVSWLQSKLRDLRSWMSSKWDDIKSDAKSDWNTIYDNITSPVKSAYNWVTDKLDKLRHWLSSKWDDISGDASKGWGGLKRIMGSPINFVINDVYMGGIRRLWDDVMNAVGLSSLDLPSVSPIKFAAGGRLSGFGGGDRNLALLEDGEAVVDKDRTRKFAPVLSAMGVPGFAKGGLVGDASAVAKMTLAAATGNETAFTNALKNFLPGGHGGAEGHWASLITTLPVRMVEHLIKGTWNKITHAAASSGGGGGGSSGPGAPGGGNAQNAALARKMYPSWGSGREWSSWNSLAMGESGWNSRIQNAASGALGIAQALGHGVAGGGGTYGNQYGGYGLNLAGDRAANSGNAGSQITWMHNYLRSSYGDPIRAYSMWLSRNPHWYSAGGPASGVIGVGEHGRELIKVPNGSTVIPHGASESMLAGALAAGGGQVQLVVSSEGQSEFEQFMVTAIRKWVRTKGGGNVQTAFGRT